RRRGVELLAIAAVETEDVAPGAERLGRLATPWRVSPRGQPESQALPGETEAIGQVGIGTIVRIGPERERAAPARLVDDPCAIDRKIDRARVVHCHSRPERLRSCPRRDLRRPCLW